MHEARADILPNQVLGNLVRSLLRHLHLQLTRAKLQIHQLLAALLHVLLLGRALSRRSPFPSYTCNSGIMFRDLVTTGYTQGHAALANEGGNVRGGEEDERNGEVLDQRYVEPVFALELDVGAFEEIESGLEEAAFLGHCEEEAALEAGGLVSW